MSSPFVHTRPVAPPVFQGRSGDLRRITSHICDKGTSWGIVSEARAGATSLLNQAEQTLRSAPRLVCSRVDLGVQDSAYNARAFWADALAPLRAGTAGPRIQALTDAALSSPTPEALAGIAAELELRRTRLVLFLDDFDAILYLPNIREHRLLAVLRSLAQRDPPPICLVFSTRTDLESLGRALERHSSCM